MAEKITCQECGHVDEKHRFVVGECPVCSTVQGDWESDDGEAIYDPDPPNMVQLPRHSREYNDIPPILPDDEPVESEEPEVVADAPEEAPTRSKKIAVIGYSRGGKTFLINRLKDVAQKEVNSLGTLRPGAKQIPVTPARDIHTYHFVDKSIRRFFRCHGYTLVDVPGETLVHFMLGPAADARLADAKTHRRAAKFIETILDADAILLVAPASHMAVDNDLRGRSIDDLGIIGPDKITLLQGQDVLDQITLLFAVIVKILNTRGTTEREKLAQRGISPEELENILSARRKIKIPIAVTFSVTDRLLANAGAAAELGADIDPWYFAETTHPQLFKTVTDHCTKYRFSFTTAFRDHPSGVYEVNYKRNHYGVTDTFQWLFDELFPLPAPAKWIRSMLRGHDPFWSASQTTLKLRRWIEGSGA